MGKKDHTQICKFPLQEKGRYTNSVGNTRYTNSLYRKKDHTQICKFPLQEKERYTNSGYTGSGVFRNSCILDPGTLESGVCRIREYTIACMHRIRCIPEFVYAGSGRQLASPFYTLRARRGIGGGPHEWGRGGGGTALNIVNTGPGHCHKKSRARDKHSVRCGQERALRARRGIGGGPHEWGRGGRVY